MTEHIGSMMYPAQGALHAVVYRPDALDVTTDLAAQMLRVQTVALAAELENSVSEGLRLPTDTIARHLRPDSFDAIRDYQDAMVNSMDSYGSVYGTISATGHILPRLEADANIDDGDLVAAAKVSPQYDPFNGRVYTAIEMLAVHPAAQHQGLGSAAVHAVLRMGDFDLTSPVRATVCAGNTSAERFMTDVLGLVPQTDRVLAPMLLTDNGDQITARLAQMSYTTVPSMTLHGVIRRLEAHKPWLAHYYPWTRP